MCKLIVELFQTPYNPKTDKKIPPKYVKFLNSCFEFDHKKRWTAKKCHRYLDELSEGMTFTGLILSDTSYILIMLSFQAKILRQLCKLTFISSGMQCKH